MRIFFILILLLTSCTYIPDKEIDVVLLNSHAYEQFFPVPYYVEYTYENEVKKLYLSDGIKRVRIKVKRGENAIIKATPFNITTPTLGGCYHIGDDEVFLKESEGDIATALLEAFYYNHNVVKVNYDALLTIKPQSFDLFCFIQELTEGKFKSFKAQEKVKFSLVDLPSGFWYSARSDVMNLDFRHTETEQRYKMELFPGLYSFYNPERKMEFILEVTNRGKILSHIKN